MKPQTAEQKLSDARVMLVRRWPFFARLALEPAYEPADWLGTMATDGASIFYNPAFVDQTPLAELVGVLAHEGAHNGFAHHARRGNREHDLWNQACDYVINPMIQESGLALPGDALLDSRFTSAMSAEQVYKVLERERQEQASQSPQAGQQAQPGQHSKDGKPGMAKAPDGRQCPDSPGAVLDMPAESDGSKPGPGEVAAEITKAQARLAQAVRIGKQRGTLPASIAAAVGAELAPKVDWRAVLQDWANELAVSDYAWSRPHRGYMVESDIYAPSARDRTMGPLVVAIDTSGSVPDADVRQFAGEVAAIHASLRPTELHVISCDAAIQRHDTYGPDDRLRLATRHGRGGTAFKPVFDHVAAQGIEPVGLVYLTDLHGDRPADPGYPVIWVSTDPRYPAPGFGQRIDLV